MAQFRSFQQMDEATLEDGERGFVRMNARARPSQLEPGEVALSQNGRMGRDNTWQPRRAITSLSGSLTTSGDALRIPFYIIDETGGWAGPDFLRITGTISPDINRDFYPDPSNGLYVADENGDSGAGGFYEAGGGNWDLYSDFGALSWSSDAPAASPDLVSSWSPVGGATGTLVVTKTTQTMDASRAGEVVTLTVNLHGLEIGTSGYLEVTGLTGTVDPNGIRFVTIVDLVTITFEIDGATGSETYAGTGLILTQLDDDAATAIHGSCTFSDPSSENAEYIFVAANTGAYAVPVGGGANVSIAYPDAELVEDDVHMVQAFDRVFLFRDGQRTLEWLSTLGFGTPIVSADRNATTVTLEITGHGLSEGDQITVSGLVGTTSPNGTYPVDSVVDADNITIELSSGSGTETYTGTGSAVGAFQGVSAGAYTQPKILDSASNVDIANGLATATEIAHGLSSGDAVTIFDKDTSQLVEGASYPVYQILSADSFTFYANAEDVTNASVVMGKPQSVGRGFIHSPAPPWGVYHQRRMWVPYWYSPGGTDGSPTYTDRETRDEMIASDILDSDTYDVIGNQYRITAGLADYTVGAHPFAEDNLVVFQRNSIHLVKNISGSLADVATNELTREIGCLARQSIVTYADRILFLSDNGVYSISFLDQYNLRGTELPLSEPIQPFIDRINADLADKALGIYHDNRYWLAVPLDATAGQGDALGNNTLLVYNFLNEGWESVDTVNDADWLIIGLHKARAGKRNDLYVVNTNGGVHKIDGADDDRDEICVQAGQSEPSMVAVSSAVTLRQYDYKTLDRKRFVRLQIQAQSSAALPSDASIGVTIEDQDEIVPVTTIAGKLGSLLAAGEDALIPSRIGGQRGSGASITFVPISGRPSLKSARIEATTALRSTTSTQ